MHVCRLLLGHDNQWDQVCCNHNSGSTCSLPLYVNYITLCNNIIIASNPAFFFFFFFFSRKREVGFEGTLVK